EGIYFARYLNSAAEGFFRFMLGRRYEEIIAKAYIQPHHDLSYENVIFAELDGIIVGMFSGYTAEQHRLASKQVLKDAAGRWNVRMLIVSVVFAPLLRIIDSITDEDFYLQAIAVETSLQGKGIGSKLMNSVEDLARKRGAKRLALDVSAKNANARQLYERRGYSIESTWPKHFSTRAFEFHRMIKQLD
ncbi:MAG: GNAT family N-acetyltransferase, partial [Gammaproteobacteria bacterium]|nr:GNAT family N-acetyltransferase [Gammaproteobacteria bacterium]